nr:MAG TPA: hypothetical protein [Caudoviricetes sp.]
MKRRTPVLSLALSRRPCANVNTLVFHSSH